METTKTGREDLVAMLELYGVYRSRASRPLWLLLETGTAFRHVPVIQAHRAHDANATTTASPEFLRLNPQGQVPVLVDGDLVLTESLAITLHIARSHGRLLGPQDAGELSLMEQWTLFAATQIETPALEIQLAVRSGADRTPEGRAGIRLSAERLRRPLARLNAHLDTTPWVVGRRFTVADVNVAECLRYAEGHPAIIDEFPATRAWLTACHARPAFRTMWERRAAEPA